MQEIYEKFMERYKAERNPARNTVLALQGIIPKFLSFCQGKGREDINQITREDVIKYLNFLNDSRTSTKKTHKAIITLFMNACLSYGYLTQKISAIPFKGAADVPRAPLKGFTAEEMSIMAQNLNRLGLRERIIFNLVSNRPLRISELASLTIGDVDLQAKNFTIYRSKNTKTRTLSLPRPTWGDLKKFIPEDKPKEESLFGVHLGTLQRMVSQMIKKLRVPLNGRNSHAFRHTVIMSMLRDAKIEAGVVAALAGNTPQTIYSSYASQVSIDEQKRAEQTFDQVNGRRERGTQG